VIFRRETKLGRGERRWKAARRLDFDVEHGLYQSNSTSIGLDGIWKVKKEPALIIEVKVTDDITIPLDKLAAHKECLTSAEMGVRWEWQ